MTTNILADNGASSGSAGLKSTADSSGVLVLQTTTSGGTATNAVYVNASQNVGFRTTPAAWGSAAKAIQVGARASLFEYNGATTDVMNNGYWNGTDYVYLETATAGLHRISTGRHQLYSAASGTAGTAIAFTNVLQVEKDYTLALQGGTSGAGTGIAFPATQSASSDANTLDDYEEGTWTPTTSTSGYTIFSATGRYTKIGNIVHVYAAVNFSAVNASSNSDVVMTGLPFNGVAFGNGQPGVCREDSITGAIFVTRVGNGNATLEINSMTGVSTGSSVVLATSRVYICQNTYFMS